MKELTNGKGKSFRKLVLLDQGEYAAMQAAAEHRQCSNNKNDTAVQQQQQQQEQLVKTYLDSGGSKNIADRLDMYRMAVAKQQHEAAKAQRASEAPPAVAMATAVAAPNEPTATPPDEEIGHDDDDSPVTLTSTLGEQALVGLPAQFVPKARKLIALLDKSGVRTEPSTGVVVLQDGTKLADSFFPLLLRSLFVQSRDGDALPARAELLRHMAMNGITRSMVSASSARLALIQYGGGGARPRSLTTAATVVAPVMVARRRHPQQRQKKQKQPPGKRAKILYMY